MVRMHGGPGGTSTTLWGRCNPGSPFIFCASIMQFHFKHSPTTRGSSSTPLSTTVIIIIIIIIIFIIIISIARARGRRTSSRRSFVFAARERRPPGDILVVRGARWHRGGQKHERRQSGGTSWRGHGPQAWTLVRTVTVVATFLILSGYYFLFWWRTPSRRVVSGTLMDTNELPTYFPSAPCDDLTTLAYLLGVHNGTSIFLRKPLQVDSGIFVLWSRRVEEWLRGP